MINKKLKSFLEYKAIHPKPNNDQTLLKLKALQKSHQKSREKRKNSSNHSKNHSQSFVETTQSTFKNTITADGQRFKSITNQIKDLQQKVQYLFSDKNPEMAIQRQRTPSATKRSNFSKGKDRSATERDIITPRNCYLKNDRLRTSFLNTYETSNTISSPIRDLNGDCLHLNYRQLVVIKMQACKLLTALNIQASAINYFDNIQNIESVFEALKNVLNLHYSSKMKQVEASMRQKQQRSSAIHINQVQFLKASEKNLQNRIMELQKQRQQLHIKNCNLDAKIQQQQTQIYQLKVLYEQSESRLVKKNLEHKIYEQKKLPKIMLSYEQKINRQLNDLQKSEYHQVKLRSMIKEEIEKNRQLQLNKKILSDELEKWERQYIRLMERYEIQKNQKEGIEHQNNIELQKYTASKKLVEEGYHNIIQKMSNQAEELRLNIGQQCEQIKNLKQVIKCNEHKLKQLQAEYIALNNDYSREVKQWVNKEEAYEYSIKDLRLQIHELHDTISQYSKMLTSSVKAKSSILSITQND